MKTAVDIPFDGMPTAEEARTIARCLKKENPTLATGLTLVVTYLVLRGSGNRSAIRAIRAAPLVGSISDERIRLESPDETIELRIAGNQVVERTDQVVVARVANGQRVCWICRSTFASPQAWDDACALIVRG